LQQVFWCTTATVSAVQKVQFVSNRISHVVLRDRWCNIVLNVHEPSEKKCDDSKHSFHEELDKVFNHFPKNHIKLC
jgi:hypothetical protein